MSPKRPIKRGKPDKPGKQEDHLPEELPLRRTCGAMIEHRRLLNEDPAYAARRSEIESLANAYRMGLRSAERQGITRIPVVVHVVWNTAAQNISDAQVQSQIVVLNQDYRMANPDISQTPPIFQPCRGDPRIEFFLATQDPNGSPTSGITRTQTSQAAFSMSGNPIKHAGQGGADAWPSDRYLNIWVAPSILDPQGQAGILGYAQFPGGPADTDGVVILHSAFGTTGSAAGPNNPYNRGRTATHEIGHWLDLYHIWGDDGTGCGGTDEVDDTPNQAGPNYGCPHFPHPSCGNDNLGGDMFMNYMDYTDDACMYMFTAGQVARMQAALDGPRQNLGAEAQFEVTTFSPWPGYVIPNGVWLPGDFTGDGKTDIVHAVANTDYVHPWLSNGNGTFNVTKFSPWAGYVIPNGQWLVGDFNGDGKADIVHLVANTDYVHTWFSNGDGTFNVTTFKPWPGYVISNGLWLVGDFNGDGRDDILHAVEGADYVDTWFSNGDGTFNVVKFSPWAGYVIPNGVWLVGDFNGDGKADIVHAVQNTDYVHTWMSNGDGTFNVGTFSPWAGYVIPNGLWMVGDFNGDGKADIVHAVEKTDYVHTWLSRGDGTFNVTTFSPWAGYVIPNGLWLVGKFDSSGCSGIVHAVEGTDYVHTWRSNGDGTYVVGTFKPWAGYVIPNGLWLPGDYNGDQKTDIVHAVQNTGYVHVWTSKMT